MKGTSPCGFQPENVRELQPELLPELFSQANGTPHAAPMALIHISHQTNIDARGAQDPDEIIRLLLQIAEIRSLILNYRRHELPTEVPHAVYEHFKQRFVTPCERYSEECFNSVGLTLYNLIEALIQKHFRRLPTMTLMTRVK